MSPYSIVRSNIICILLISVLGACQNDKVSQLQSENKSLRQALAIREAEYFTLKEVTRILDSIDHNRNVAGEPSPDVKKRLRDVHHYILESEQKIASIEKNLSSAKNRKEAYAMMATALRDEVDINAEDIGVLTDTAGGFVEVNEGMLEDMKEKEEAITGLYTQVKEKQRSLQVLEDRVQELMRLTEAEDYYARAQVLEKEAESIRFAPGKKRETLSEALELYIKAFALGKKEAGDNIISIQSVLGAAEVAGAGKSGE